MRFFLTVCVLCPTLAWAQTPLALGDYEVQTAGNAETAARMLPGLTQKRSVLEAHLKAVSSEKRPDVLFRLAGAAWDEARFKAAAQSTPADYRAAVRWFQALLETAPNHGRIPSARYHLARHKLETALAAGDAKTAAQAVRELQPMVGRGVPHPHRVESHLWMAEFFYAQSKWAKARALLGEVTAVDGGAQRWARYRLAWIMAREGDLDGAAATMAALAPTLRNDRALALRAPVDAAWFRAQKATQKQ